MEPDNLRFGGGVSGTLLHPLVAVELVLTILLVLCLPRKYAIVPLLLMIFLTPRGQVVVLAGVHFTIARLLIVTALVRLGVSGGPSPFAGGFNSLDRMFALFATTYLLVFSLQWMESQALIKSLGDYLDALGGYCVMRFLIRDRGGIIRVIKTLAVIAIITAPFMIIEQRTHMNLFGLLGGVATASAIREGQVRSQGAFAVYITAGTFGGSLIPMLIWLWTTNKKARLLVSFGMGAATIMVLTSHSSTPTLAYAFGLLGLCFWPVRRWMRMFRWGLSFTLIGLHLAMKAPVWALIARVDLTGSSSGYQRYMLIDTCIRHFWDWWLIGVKNYNTWGFDMWDLSDQYVAYAVTGGLLTLALFIGIISSCFGRIGRMRKLVAGDRKHEWLLWCLGSAILAHVAAFFGIGYFDQMAFAWYALLAMVTVAVNEAIASTRTRTQQPVTTHELQAAVGV